MATWGYFEEHMEEKYIVKESKEFVVEDKSSGDYITIKLCDSFNMTVKGMPEDSNKMEFRDLEQAELYSNLLKKAIEVAKDKRKKEK
jgi:hypothetical protein